MPFVVDASVTLEWLLPDEATDLAERALERLATDEAVVPSLWWFEVRNALLSAERRGRLAPNQTQLALARLAGLRISLDHDVDEAVLLAVARQCRLTVYDAAYLELALRRGLPLATLDRELARAAAAESVSELD